MKKISIEDMKQNNKKLLLGLVVKHPNVSRLELSKLSGFSAGTITALVSELISEGKLVESGKHASTGGRPKIGLVVNTVVGDVVIFEVKQRTITSKIYNSDNDLFYEKRIETNYLNGNTIVETIGQVLELLDHKPNHIGVLIEENIKDSEISYLLSTSISQDSIPLEVALKMYLDIDVIVERSLKYLLDEEVMNFKLEHIKTYAYIHVDENLKVSVYNQGDRVIFDPRFELDINLSDTFELAGTKNKWDSLVGKTNSSLRIGNGKIKTSRNKQNDYDDFVTMFAEAIKVMLIFYPLDAIFLIGKVSLFPSLDDDLLRKINKSTLSHKLKLVQMVNPATIDAGRNMNRLITKNHLLGGY